MSSVMKRGCLATLVIGFVIFAVIWIGRWCYMRMAVERELDQLLKGEMPERIHAEEALVARGAAVVPYMVDALKRKPVDCSVRIIDVLGQIGPNAEEAVPVLVKTVQIDIETLPQELKARGNVLVNAELCLYGARDAAAVAIGDIGVTSAEIERALIDSLKKGNAGAAYALGKLRPVSAEAVTVLVAAAQKPDDSANNPVASVKALLLIAKDTRNSEIIAALAESLRLGSLAPAAAVVAAEGLGADGLRDLAKPYKQRLIEGAQREVTIEERIALLFAIARMGDQRAVELFADSLLVWSELDDESAEEESHLAKQVLAYLKEIGPEARVAVPAIVKAAKPGNCMLREQVKEALRAIVPGEQQQLIAQLPVSMTEVDYWRKKYDDRQRRIYGEKYDSLKELIEKGNKTRR